MNTNWKSIIKVYKLCKDLYIEDVSRFKEYYFMTENPIIYRAYSFTESGRVKHLLDVLELKYERFSTYDGPHVFIIEGKQLSDSTSY